MRSRALVTLWIAAVAVGGPSCQEDEVACLDEDHRPSPPGDANACHELATLIVRHMECTAEFFDQIGSEGLTSRNGELAYQYGRAGHATEAEIATCQDTIPEYQERIAAPTCAAPSQYCGPAPGPGNPCHAFYREQLDYQERCTQLVASEGMDSYEGKLDAWEARCDYATESEQTTNCGGAAYDYYADANTMGICY